MRLVRMGRISPLFLLAALVVPLSKAQDSDRTLRGMSVHQVLACAKDQKCRLHYEEWELADAISRHQNITALIDAYQGADEGQREIIVLALYSLRDLRVEAFMRTIAFRGLKPHEPDYEPQWYPLQYLARVCDGRALARLSRPENIREAYPVGCILWQDTVKAFGDCNYRPAVPYLIDALDTACLNINDNALQALKKFFPGACDSEKWPTAVQRCYGEVARKHGYTLIR